MWSLITSTVTLDLEGWYTLHFKYTLYFTVVTLMKIILLCYQEWWMDISAFTTFCIHKRKNSNLGKDSPHFASLLPFCLAIGIKTKKLKNKYKKQIIGEYYFFTNSTLGNWGQKKTEWHKFFLTSVNPCWSEKIHEIVHNFMLRNNLL